MSETNVERASRVNQVIKEYAPINGLKMYYEIHGKGMPLILIHGGAGAVENWSEILPKLSQNRQVVAIDLQAHGRTADIDRPLRYELLAEDVYALTKYLGLEKVDLMGYSLGGGVALRTAIQHPEVLRKLILVSTAVKKAGWYPEIQKAMVEGAEHVEEMKQTPMYDVYSKIAPRVEDWGTLLTKLAEMLGHDYDWSKEVSSMETPTMLVIGDADSIVARHGVEFFELLGGGKKDGGWDGSGISKGRLAILPGVTHYTIFSSPMLATIVERYLADDRH
jgi:pimeloyl-ACP methyl ester carboxylesterase